MARIIFVQNIVFEYIGVMYLSAVLKKHGHTVDVFIVTGNKDRAIRDIIAFKPDMVGFSCTTGIHNWALKFAKSLKDEFPCKVIFGGAHPTFFPDVINEPQVDIICRGEGEYPLLEIADKIDRGKDLSDTPNCWTKTDGRIVKNDVRSLIENLDEIPFPDRSIYYKYPFMRMSSSNFIGGVGCPFDCSFCFNHAYRELYKGKGRMVRYRSVSNLIEEMKDVKERYGIRTLRLVDDTFILNKKWVEEFSRRYKDEVGIPFSCAIRADIVDENVIRNLSEAGCKGVAFGIESGSDDLRNKLLRKKVTDDQIKKCAAILKKYGIKFRTFNMMGLPGETIEDAFKTVSLNVEIGTDYPWCSIFRPFYGTELASNVEESGLIDAHTDNMADISYFKDSIISSRQKDKLVNLQKLFIYAVKFPVLIPMIKRLIRLKPNMLFDAAFLISHGWGFLRAGNWSMRDLFIIGTRNVRTLFFSKD